MQAIRRCGGVGVAAFIAAAMLPWNNAAGQQADAAGLQAYILAIDLGLVPESMAIAGLQPIQATQALTSVQSAESVMQALASLEQVCQQAGEQATQLANAIVQGLADQETVAAYLAAMQQFDGAIAQANEVRNTLFAQLTTGLPTATVQALNAWRDGARYSVPAEFRARERTPQEWKAIMRALRAEARALRMGEELADEPAQLLAAVRSEPLVVQASANLQANLPAMELIFDQVAQGVDAP